MEDISSAFSGRLLLISLFMVESCGGVNCECGNGDGPSVSIANTISALISGSKLATVLTDLSQFFNCKFLGDLVLCLVFPPQQRLKWWWVVVVENGLAVMPKNWGWMTGDARS